MLLCILASSYTQVFEMVSSVIHPCHLLDLIVTIFEIDAD
jgi:hypothetical protein